MEVQVMNEKEKFYQKKWFLWLWLIIFPPVGIVLLWTIHKAMKKKTKIILSVVFAFWCILLMVGVSGDTPTDTSSTKQNEDIPATEDKKAKKTEDEIKETEEMIPHRDGMYGVSDKDIESLDIESQFTVSDVINDVTGNWRISVINKSMNFEEYALSYYKKYFTDDKEIHAIVNFAYNTTTKIQVIGDTLDITVYEYVKDEEHDAKALFSGMFLSEYIVYTDNGDIDKQEEGPDNPNANSNADATPENFLKDVKTTVEGDVGEGESITDVTFENGALCVYVDFSQTDPAPLTFEDLAISRTETITEDILTLRQYDDLWETITVDFGEVGKITNIKSSMETNALGRYFPSENYVLE